LCPLTGSSSEKNCNLIFSERDSSEDEIHRNVDHLMRSMITYGIIERYDNDINDKLTEIFFHIIHNANEIERGYSNAFGIFQINRYKNNEKIAYISICDNGDGISNTIWKKISKYEAKPYFTKNQEDPTFLFILEALFWRKRIHSIPYRLWII
jgi:hypothetical protein